MARFKLYQDAEYVMGHLRYGHREGIIEADTLGEVLKKVDDEPGEYTNFVLDDYEIDDICYDDNLIHIEEIKEEKKDDNGWIELKQGDETPDHEVIARDSYKNTLIGYVCCEGEGFICESETEVMYDVIKYREIPE